MKTYIGPEHIGRTIVSSINGTEKTNMATIGTLATTKQYHMTG